MTIGNGKRMWQCGDSVVHLYSYGERTRVYGALREAYRVEQRRWLRMRVLARIGDQHGPAAFSHFDVSIRWPRDLDATLRDLADKHLGPDGRKKGVVPLGPLFDRVLEFELPEFRSFARAAGPVLAQVARHYDEKPGE